MDSPKKTFGRSQCRPSKPCETKTQTPCLFRCFCRCRSSRFFQFPFTVRIRSSGQRLLNCVTIRKIPSLVNQPSLKKCHTTFAQCDRLRVLSGTGSARAEDAQGTPTQIHISPSNDIPVGYNPEVIGCHHVLIASFAELAKAAALTSSGYEPCQIGLSWSPARITLRTSRELFLQLSKKKSACQCGIPERVGTHHFERKVKIYLWDVPERIDPSGGLGGIIR